MSNHLRKGSLSEDSAPPLASRASEAMRLGDFKQAIDLFKRLVKQDARREWCDALAEAYAGRARSLVRAFIRARCGRKGGRKMGSGGSRTRRGYGRVGVPIRLSLDDSRTT